MHVFSLRNENKPWGLQWRSSFWFVTFGGLINNRKPSVNDGLTKVVSLGTMTDIMIYSLIIPVIPFRLEALGYRGVSGLVGWLLFAYCSGLVISTPPIASLSERYKNRQIPLVIGLVALAASQVMFMEAQKYWVMCLARVLQGFSSSVIFVVGLALICDSTPESLVGRQLGIAMGSMTVGLLVGPAAAGVLYSRWGFRAPFIFGIIVAAVDLFCRFLIIERKDALVWGVDSAAEMNHAEPRLEVSDKEAGVQEITMSLETTIPSLDIRNEKGIVLTSCEITVSRPPLTPLGILIKLLRSWRAVICIFNIFVFGVVYGGQEAILTLHLQAVWGLSSSQAGLSYIAAVLPAFFSMSLAGWWSDLKGTEGVICLFLLLCLPWWGVITINGSLAQFLVFLGTETFFTAGFASPLTAEFAIISRNFDGVGYAHVYGVYNLAYGVGSAVGPIISGQIYDHTQNGWKIFCLLSLGLLVLCMILSFIFVGERPLARRLIRTYQTVTSRE